MVARTASLNEEDIWHVQVADGDLRIVTVDQLDDLFRLDLIDDNVNVWQPGMPTWQPLKVVAGMDEDSLKQVPPVSRPPPAPPKRAVAPATVSAPWAPAPNLVPSFAPSTLGPLVSHSLSSDLDFRPRASGGGLGRVLLGLLAVVGISVTAYRNGLVRDAAHSVQQDALYQRAETALGPPGFGTLSSVDRLTGAAALALADSQPAAASATEPLRASVAAALKLPEPSAPVAPTPVAPATATPTPAPAPVASTPAASTQSSPTKTVSFDTLPHEASAPAPVRPAAMQAGGTPKASASAKPGGKGLSSGLKGSSNAYDPLNGKL